MFYIVFVQNQRIQMLISHRVVKPDRHPENHLGRNHLLKIAARLSEKKNMQKITSGPLVDAVYSEQGLLVHCRTNWEKKLSCTLNVYSRYTDYVGLQGVKDHDSPKVRF